MERPWTVTLGGGVSLFTFSDSSALGNLIKPHLRLRFDYRIHPMLRLGGEVSAVASGSSGTAVIGGWLIGRMAMWQNDSGALELAWGLGLGHAAPILDEFLRTDTSDSLMHYSYVGLETRWHVGSGVMLGVEALFEHLSVVTLNLTLGYRL